MKMRSRWSSHYSHRGLVSKECATPDQCLTPLELAMRFTNGNLGNINHYDDFQNRFAVRPSYDLSDSDRMSRYNDSLQLDLEASLEEDKRAIEEAKKLTTEQPKE